MENILCKIKRIIGDLSTKPNRFSYYWREGYSVLSLIFLHFIYVERFFSLLQWVKSIYRNTVFTTTDSNSKRRNVPPQVVEIYFLVVSALILPTLFLHTIPYVYKVLTWYFLIDTSVWMLYYFFFRRFFEENYAIMHRLEYIVVFPLVVFIQMLCVCTITCMTPVETLQCMFNPDSNTPVALMFLSVFYTAVVLGLIISNLPMEHIKVQGDCNYIISIIGNGSVVQNRLLPAIRRYAIISGQHYFPVAQFDEQKSEGIYCIYDERDRKNLLASKILWVATPSYAHYRYIGEYITRIPMLVCEKPITTSQDELTLIERLCTSKYRDNLFFLSYYYLEKALPFVYLTSPLGFYIKYLNISNATVEEVRHMYASIGGLRSVDIWIHEKDETRLWTMQDRYGGQLYETFIHPAVLCLAAMGEDTILADEKFDFQQDVNTANVDYQGKSEGGVSIHLSIIKNSSVEENRGAVFTYANGKVEVDFSLQKTTIYQNEQELACISTKPEFGKYEIQLDMVMRCYENESLSSYVDGRTWQIKAIKWLQTLSKKNTHRI